MVFDVVFPLVMEVSLFQKLNYRSLQIAHINNFTNYSQYSIFGITQFLNWCGVRVSLMGSTLIIFHQVNCYYTACAIIRFICSKTQCFCIILANGSKCFFFKFSKQSFYIMLNNSAKRTYLEIILLTRWNLNLGPSLGAQLLKPPSPVIIILIAIIM